MKLPCCQDEALRKALVRFRVPADATALVSCGSCAKLFEATTKFIYKINTHTQPDSAICQVCKPEDAEDLLEIAAEQAEGEDA